jgi:diguanylate cyclase (GGDEF)-like protein/PAS domain S-box-containing protein
MVSPEFYEKLLDQLYDGVYFVDRERRITYWNAGAERITGYGRAEVVGRFCFHNILRHVDKEGRHLCLRGCPLQASIGDGQPRSTEVFLHHRDGYRVPVRVRVTPILDQAGAVVGAAEVFSQKTARAEAERRLSDLRRRLLIDQLTQVPNRQYVEQAISARLHELRSGGQPFGVLFIDIDRFKSFNDRHGHHIGDQALKTVASTLAGCVRPTDVVARWGGEEFLGVFGEVDAEGLDAVCQKLLVVVRNSDVLVGERHLALSVSIGATMARLDDDRESLVKRADRLLYQSKAQGRDRATVA